MFSKIVVPVDGTGFIEAVVPYAAALAEAMNVPVQLLHAVDPATLTAEDHELTGHGVVLEGVAGRGRRDAQQE